MIWIKRTSPAFPCSTCNSLFTVISASFSGEKTATALTPITSNPNGCHPKPFRSASKLIYNKNYNHEKIPLQILPGYNFGYHPFLLQQNLAGRQARQPYGGPKFSGRLPILNGQYRFYRSQLSG